MTAECMLLKHPVLRTLRLCLFSTSYFRSIFIVREKFTGRRYGNKCLKQPRELEQLREMIGSKKLFKSLRFTQFLPQIFRFKLVKHEL